MGQTKQERRQKIRYGIRRKISGTADVPRLSIYRSNKEIYAQLVDDKSGVTLCGASSVKGGKGTKVEQAKLVGQKLADLAKGLNISSIKFDRSGYLFHGRVKALADGAREGGLNF